MQMATLVENFVSHWQHCLLLVESQPELPTHADYLRLSRYLRFSDLHTDIVRHPHHLTKCPFEVNKGLKGIVPSFKGSQNKL